MFFRAVGIAGALTAPTPAMSPRWEPEGEIQMSPRSGLEQGSA